MPPKRKRSSMAAASTTNVPSAIDYPSILPPGVSKVKSAAPKRQISRRVKVNSNPDDNADIIDGKAALRASPDADEPGEGFDLGKVDNGISATNSAMKVEDASDSSLSDLNGHTSIATPAKKLKRSPTKSSIAAKKGSDEIKAFRAQQAANKAAETKLKKEQDADEWDSRQDPDGDEAGPAEDAKVLKLEAARPPPVNSDYLPLPWKGRLGYACLNTYLRFSNPPIFSSRTCRIASILEHRHPLKDPTQSEHATKNRPDKSQPASIERGQRYVEELGLANAKDIVKMLRWNDKYGIRFLRLSSEMFPFASHAEYGYKLAPFAGEALAEAGRVAAELGHRLSTHPGQFTQLGSARPEVIANSVRDLEYHNELLSLLKLPPQADRDAVLILHLGGTFGDKGATLDRFRENFKNLSPSIKQRIVLENDDVSWSVHDLLPLCEELNIPLCLDFHHNNIIFDSTKLREGTLDIMKLYPRIKATWERKQITQKIHYSEPTPEAITGRQRRKHNPRPLTLPPCANDMDLMIEAKDKEQAVFELMRTFKLPGWNTFNNIVPYERADDNKPLPRKAKKKKTKKQVAAEIEEFGKELSSGEEEEREIVPEEEVGMGGKDNRVYWPLGMEEWLRPKKREVKKKGGEDDDEIFKNPTPANFAARKAVEALNKEPLSKEFKARLADAKNVSEVQKVLQAIKVERSIVHGAEEELEHSKSALGKKAAAKKRTPAKNTVITVSTPSISSVNEVDELSMPDFSAEGVVQKAVKVAPARQRGRSRGKGKNYAGMDEDLDEE